jgi:nitrite reductase (NADH) small subunit/3-phenylpropionate/trans-cinnamate dioxygenase ferredoxin subunit
LEYEYHQLPLSDEIPEGCGRVFEIGSRRVAVFNDGGRFFAIDDQCPHMGASLAEGAVENHVVTCPWHAWRFDIRDGTWCDNRRVRIDSFPVEVGPHGIRIGIPRGGPAND